MRGRVGRRATALDPAPGGSPLLDGRLVAQCRAQLLATLARCIAPGRSVVLLDVPHHANVGDNAILLGELAALRALGRNVRTSRPPRRATARACRTGSAPGASSCTGAATSATCGPPISWLRERILAEFPERPHRAAPAEHRLRPGRLSRPGSPGIRATSRVHSARARRAEPRVRPRPARHFRDSGAGWRICARTTRPRSAPSRDVLVLARTDPRGACRSAASARRGNGGLDDAARGAPRARPREDRSRAGLPSGALEDDQRCARPRRDVDLGWRLGGAPAARNRPALLGARGRDGSAARARALAAPRHPPRGDRQSSAARSAASMDVGCRLTASWSPGRSRWSMGSRSRDSWHRNARRVQGRAATHPSNTEDPGRVRLRRHVRCARRGADQRSWQGAAVQRCIGSTCRRSQGKLASSWPGVLPLK